MNKYTKVISIFALIIVIMVSSLSCENIVDNNTTVDKTLVDVLMAEAQLITDFIRDCCQGCMYCSSCQSVPHSPIRQRYR